MASVQEDYTTMLHGRRQVSNLSSIEWKGVAPAQHGYDQAHTPENPYCDELACWCKTDEGYHDLVTSFGDDYDSDQYDRAMAFLSGNG